MPDTPTACPECAYLEKAAREAKRRTSWVEPDERYETALHACDGSGSSPQPECHNCLGVDRAAWMAQMERLSEAEVERLTAAVDEMADAALNQEGHRREAEAEVERLTALLDQAREALRPFVTYYEASMASRSPLVKDDMGVATISNNMEGDTSITVGHLRAALAALRSTEDQG